MKMDKQLLEWNETRRKIHAKRPDLCEAFNPHIDTGLCPNKKIAKHECPYKMDIDNDFTTMCDCCHSCSNDCFRRI